MVYVKRAVPWRFGPGSGEGPLAMDAGRDSCTGSAQMQCDGTGSGEGPGTALEAARTCRIQWEMSQGARECLVLTGSEMELWKQWEMSRCRISLFLKRLF